jgi:hypothetical protein
MKLRLRDELRVRLRYRRVLCRASATIESYLPSLPVALDHVL